MTSAGTRRAIAGAIPLVSGNLSFLLRTALLVLFLWQYAPLTPPRSAGGGDARVLYYDGLAVWSLTALGVAAGVRLSAGDRLYKFERDGRLYKALGVR